MSFCKSYAKRDSKRPVLRPDGTIRLPPINFPNIEEMRTNTNLLNFKLSREKQEINNKMLLEKAVQRYEKAKQLFDSRSRHPEPRYPREMMTEARLQRMNYQTLRECVQKAPVPELQQHWIDGVFKMIPKSFTNQSKMQETANYLVEEIKNDFVKAMRELTEQFEKGDTMARRSRCSHKLLDVTRFDVISRSGNFTELKGKIRLNLHLYRQSVTKVFEFGKLFLETRTVCDFHEICQKSPLSLANLNAIISKECDAFEENVMSKWFPEVVKIVKFHDKVERLKKNQTRGYHRCLSNVMSVQLRNVLQRSVDSWVKLISSNDSVQFSHHLYFQAALTFEDGVIQFYPSFEDFEVALCAVVDKIVATLQLIPSINSYLSEDQSFHDYRYIACKLPQENIEEIYCLTKNILKKRFAEAEEHMRWFRVEFLNLMDGSAMLEVENVFVKPDKSWNDYLELSKSYKRMADEISLLPKEVTLDLLIVDCDDLKRDLIKAARSLSQYILSQMASELACRGQRIRKDYNDTFVKASSTPLTSEQLIDLVEFIESARVNELIQLEKRVETYGIHLLQLAEFYLFPVDQLILNVEVFQWREKITPVFEQSGQRTESMKSLAQKMLESSSLKVFEEINQIKKRTDEFIDYTDIEQMGFYAKVVKEVQMRLAESVERGRWINREEMMYKIPVTSFQEADDVASVLDLYYRLFLVVSKWTKAEKRWMDGTFLELSASQIEADLEDYTQELYKVNKQLSNRFRKTLKTVDGESHQSDFPPVLSVISKVLEVMRKFRGHIPVISVLCNLGLRTRHWQQMSEVSMFDLTPDSSTTLRRMLTLNLGPFMDQFEAISTSASKEFSLEKAMNKMKEDWKDMAFSIVQYRDTGLSVLASVDEVQMMLEDQIVKTQTMRGSPFIKPFEKEVKAWEDRMIFIQDAISEWLRVQSQWLYLSPIFGSQDITRQMPNESRMFKAVDEKWRNLMTYLSSHPMVLSATNYPNLVEVLKECMTLLDSILKGLNIYLEDKRLYFPRFFFLSNDEMLEILSETKDPTRVESHLKKCFEGINRLQFDEELNISAMFSTEMEKVDLFEMVSTKEANGAVERWLLRVQEVMFLSIKEIISRSNKAYLCTERVDWVRGWPGQVVLCVSQMQWTSNVHEAIRCSAMKSFWHQLNEQLSRIVELVRGNLTQHERITMGALVVLDVHARDVINDMVSKNVTDEKDFAWLAQLRYYWENAEDVDIVDNDKDDVYMSVINARAKYGYEYLGNTERLVITPLTDRCYRTLMGAFHLNLNGAPEGPAGTGKTETTKDLAKAIAVHCVVFNCSDGLDYISMGKFFKGLASSGAWSCFDEFNRIELEVLSVVAQQILCIMNAIQAREQKFTFEGTDLSLNPNCFICVTMNPGYAGRSELPDNLRVLFRTVAMMVPDYALIAEISLYSYGFLDARRLSVKIITTYKLCSEQLSSQFHYDYGMRAVKAVLSAAGNLKLALKEIKEDVLLLKSIMDINLPKFLSHDIPLFEGIISDLFPGVTLSKMEHSIFLESVERVCKKNGFQMVPFLREKIVQMFEMMHVRHGFMLVGEPLGGKSVVIKTMAESLNLLKDENHTDFEGAKYKVINPKSITMGQLYGQFDAVSHEWSDGLVANMFREFASGKSKERKWVIFDGPIDALWVENMNTVLDDNKKLCLASGEVISMPSAMNIIFETLDLSQASPATVSRCGMIYFESKSLGWKCFMDSWLNSLPDLVQKSRKPIETFLMFILDPCLDFVHLKCKPGYLATTPIVLAHSFFNVTASLVSNAYPYLDNKDSSFIFSCVVRLMLFGLVWTVGGLLDSEDRLKFDYFLKDILNKSSQSSAADDGVVLSMPHESLYNCYAVIEPMTYGGNQWPTWLSKLEGKSVEKSVMVQEPLVPTADTERCNFFLELSIKYDRPILFVGPTGTGKSMYVRHKLMTESKAGFVTPAFINFSAQSTANQIQDLILSKLEKKRKGYYGAPTNKKCVIFIDDFNLPLREKYGAQPPLELLRFKFDQGHWYDLKDTSVLHLRDLQFVGAMVPRDGMKAPNPRLLRHFHVISINPFSDDTMILIFSTLVSNFFENEPDLGLKMILATKEVYKSSIAHLRPTPNKSHYLLNLRDFSRVINGLLLIPKEKCSSWPTMIRLWAHEVMRVFSDRLVEEEELDWFVRLVIKVIQTTFGDNYSWANAGQNLFKEELIKNLMFGNHINLDKEVDERVYEEITDFLELQRVIEQCLEEYNSVNKMKMNLVIFKYVLEHLSRIARVLLMPGGNALLVGVGGSGRQSITRLAAYISNMSILQPEVSKSYGINEWHEDIKVLLKNSGGNNKPFIFLIVDSQIKEPCFLEEIESLLNSGQVQNLFSPDELVQLSELVRSSIAANQRADKTGDHSPLELYSYFIKQCRDNLHIVLAFSPIGNSFRTRMRDFPSLINCCTIDWFHNWPKEALLCVASKYLERADIREEEKHQTSIVCEFFHSSACLLSIRFLEEMGHHTYITPTSYLDLISLLVSLLIQKQDSVTKAKQRYFCGLEKLAFAASQVSDMQKELERMKPQLLHMAEENAKMMKFINDETQEMQYTTEIVRSEEVIAKRQAASAQALKDECEAELAEAIPALEMAIAALDTLKPSDITIVKSMVNPPSGVKLVMAAVCVIKGIPPERVSDPSGIGGKVMDYWGPSKKLLSDLNFLRDLKEFDKDSLQPLTMTKIRREFITNPDFDPFKVANASSAAEGLCRWVLAMEIYDRVAKVVAPKKDKMQCAEAELKKTLEHLKLKRHELKGAEERLNNLKTQYQVMVDKKEKLGFQVDLCEKKLDRAKRLIRGLGGEKSRWQQATYDLQDIYEGLLGDVLVSSGIISYLGPFTPTFRDNIVADWVKMCRDGSIPISKEFSLMATLGDPVKIQTWNIAGLPKDSFSIDNAVIIANSKKWPLMIDPQGQANQWLKNMEKESKLHVIRFTNSDYMRTLENCITFGNPVLLENVGEELDPSLESLLLKQTFKQNGTEMIRLGENIIEYSSEFRFYITTKMRNPHYFPSVSTKVLLLNFMITCEGLEDQLLGLVVTKERPELEGERQELILLSADISRQLREIEDRILYTLQSSEGNILEDETTVDFLDKSKTLSNDITEKQQVALVTEKQIEESRQCYRPVAQHSAILFFCVAELPNLDPMYQFSLNWFINLYISSIIASNKAKSLDKRLQNLMSYFQLNLFENICRSISINHRLVFSFLMCSNILVSAGEMNREEILFFLTGGIGLKPEIPNPDPSWISEKMWGELCIMVQLDVFKGFPKSFIENLALWRAWHETPLAVENKMPAPWNSVTDFHRMVVIRIIRPDRVVCAVQKFISLKMGSSFVESPKFDLMKSFEDSNFSTPLIFILSPGADPIQQLLKFSLDKGFDAEKLNIVSLGQGQGPMASRVIERAKQRGTWVLLQNCHLAISWMPSLEKICESLNRENTHPDFRLWLSSYPSDKFPVSILQNGIKMTNEIPTGIKQNLLQSYTSEPISNPNFFYGCPNKQLVFEKLMFGLCLFHGVLQERKKFGSMGFNVSYAFNGSDLRISLRQLQLLINDYESVPYDVITYLVGECNYGGRVTDDRDRRCLLTILEDFCNADVVNMPRYKFSSSPSYYAPPKGSLESYIEFIKNLPLYEDHELFGMHENVMTMKHIHDTRHFFDNLLSIFGVYVNVSGSKNDDQVITITCDILGKLLGEFNLNVVKNKYPVSYGDAMNALLTQEMARFNRLTSNIRGSLKNLQNAVRGLSVMSAELESLGNSVLTGRIPQSWMIISYPSPKSLASYIHDLVQRQQFFQSWYEKGTPNIFWISGFFFIQAFLTGVMQNFARTYKIPIDQLEYDNQMMKSSKNLPPPEVGAYVHGLFLEGAKWDSSKNIIVDEDSKTLHYPVPVIWFKPLKKVKVPTSDERYRCPLYNTTQRSGVLSTTGHSTNFVCFIPLDTKQPSRHWVKRGTALICQLDD